ncbi:hypothetical protein BDK51DRAFT_34479 [Blyttiomyces helicus]|uniref:Uncharacterized protein n=1 Tax=Blyttiomyces helicus TaxID=388810 RepID=A0A4P9WIP7_9FUNG|nr:hypothetical protein BDK51DRAFT_34479 [Blyttiomyces helicus]|eukprot:RKO91318.1 hypothetical protein BDK51DRAFT_34479 [Blyttiomyces helicus]
MPPINLLIGTLWVSDSPTPAEMKQFIVWILPSLDSDELELTHRDGTTSTHLSLATTPLIPDIQISKSRADGGVFAVPDVSMNPGGGCFATASGSTAPAADASPPAKRKRLPPNEQEGPAPAPDSYPTPFDFTAAHSRLQLLSKQLAYTRYQGCVVTGNPVLSGTEACHVAPPKAMTFLTKNAQWLTEMPKVLRAGGKKDHCIAYDVINLWTPSTDLHREYDAFKWSVTERDNMDHFRKQFPRMEMFREHLRECVVLSFQPAGENDEDSEHHNLIGEE